MHDVDLTDELQAKAMFDTSVGVIVGDSAVFQLTIGVPLGVINFDVLLTGQAGECCRRDSNGTFEPSKSELLCNR